MKVLKNVTVSVLDLCVGGSWTLLYSPASKSCYYQTNGPTGGTLCFYLRAKRRLGITEPVTLIDGSKSQQILWLQHQPLLYLCFNFRSVSKLYNSNMGKCCAADYINTTDSLGGNDLWFLFMDFWILAQLFRKSVNTHWMGLRLQPIDLSLLHRQKRRSHLKLKVNGKHFQTLSWNLSLKWAQASGYEKEPGTDLCCFL